MNRGYKIWTRIAAFALLFAISSCELIDETETIPVTSVEVSSSTLQLTVGDVQTLTATVKPDNATNPKVAWSSSDDTKVSVNTETGEITAIAEGIANIIATTEDGGKTAKCQVIVSDIPSAGISLSQTETITDLSGRELMIVTTKTENINIGVLPAGVYLVKAGNRVTKLIKK
ncbi:hypothetical protein AGMMS50262_21670 [Bacteroidia bacterium]|nr:hypothetical protein AGMMS50262_21670 [Bacteroidia bacterium]